MAEADPIKPKTVDLEEVDLPDLLARVAAGEEVVLAKDGRPYVRLAPVPAEKTQIFGKRPLGGLGYELPETFLDPMTDEELAEWGL